MTISMIAAMSQNRVIGINNEMPWDLPPDMKRFRKMTLGHPCIMGRKTFEALGKPLPKRPNIIITRKKDYQVEGAKVVHTLDEALEGLEGEVFIIGGGDIYSLAMPRAQKIYLTIIHRDFDGTAFFPEVPEREFEITSREDHTEPMPFSYFLYERRG